MRVSGDRAEGKAHTDRIVEAARRSVRFDLNAIRDGSGPTRVPAERIWALLPHILEKGADPE